MELNLYWFRRDLRLKDNHALYNALKTGQPVLPIFIFDSDLLKQFDENDAKTNFIYDVLEKIHRQLSAMGSGILVKYGRSKTVFRKLIQEYDIGKVFANEDYEPQAIKRDFEIKQLLLHENIDFELTKDHVVFHKEEIVKSDSSPYTVYSPYKKIWLKKCQTTINCFPSQDFHNYHQCELIFPNRATIGIKSSNIKVRAYQTQHLHKYHSQRDYPAKNTGSYWGPHLRFGTISVRQALKIASSKNETLVNELIWRDFFSQILYHFPYVEKQAFKKQYDLIEWDNNEFFFEKWREGETGYPIVDAGMKELNETGYIHNRVRMICASFLVKNLLIDWRWGEYYFAQKLLDFDLASNNGNWQWVAGCGCDAAPYFRVFNPIRQQKQYDPEFEYIKKWIPEFDPAHYIKPLVSLDETRKKAIEVYKNARMAVGL